MRRHSKIHPPHRCKKHKDMNPTWFCGKKCLKDPPKLLKIYYPFDYTYSPTQGFKKSQIRYLIHEK